MSSIKALAVLIVLLFVIINGTSFAGSSRIVQVDDDGNMGYILVKVSGSGTLWVGCTVYPAGFGKYEVNLDAQKIKGNGVAKFYVLPRMRPSESGLDYVVALWEDKISLRECEKKYGKGSERCRWARSIGYQMEGRLDRKQGSYKPGFD